MINVDREHQCDLCSLPPSAPAEIHELIHFMLRVRPRRVRIRFDLYEKLTTAVCVTTPGRAVKLYLGRSLYAEVTTK